MKQVRINSTEGKSLLILGGTMGDILPLLPEKGLYIITDTNVQRLYGESFPPGEVLTVGPGEAHKTLETVERLCKGLLMAGADRASFILGFGGGVVCDIAGMVASVYMRGVRHAFVSTTLLSQVDASIGGKNGVNLGEYKNVIGTFRQPEFVLCDHSMLATLPDVEFRSGMGELFKYGIISDRDLFADISSSADLLAVRDPGVLGDFIHRAVRIKAAVVRHDPLEKGMRRILNFGHTFGHVLETRYRIPHGMAVAQGMIIAAELSVWKGEMPDAEFRLMQLALEKAGMLACYPLPSGVTDMIARDKKCESGSLNFVLLRSVGRAVIKRLSMTEVQSFVNYYNQKKSQSL